MDLTAFDRIIVNSSGGKDSQAMLHQVATLARAQGVLDRVTVVHAALREEWAGTVDVVRAQAAAYGIPVVVVQRPQGTLLDQVRARGMWPSSTTRYCTSDHKRDQVAKVIRQTKAGRVLNCLGLRAAESPARSKRVPLERDARLSRGGRVVMTWLPIFDLTVAQVWETNRAAGTPVHPAYALGMPRLSCCFCIFAPKAALVLAGRHNRALLEEYVAVERATGHSFRKDLKLADVLEAVERGDAPGPIATWEM